MESRHLPDHGNPSTRKYSMTAMSSNMSSSLMTVLSIRQALAQPSQREVVAGLIHGTAEFLSSPGNPRGCLLIQGALACGTDAESVKMAMIDWRKSSEDAMKKRLHRRSLRASFLEKSSRQTLPATSHRSWQALAFKPPTAQQGQSCGVSLQSPCVVLKSAFRVLQAAKSAARLVRSDGILADHRLK